jgi:hypothetical protein
MALTTESAKPDPKGAKSAEVKGDAKLPEPVAAPGATDPAVQKLLADQQTAVSNGDADGIRDINAKLNELGYK